jgi:hypothetical protein
MGALETLSQLVSAAGVLQCLGVSVTDAPNFPCVKAWQNPLKKRKEEKKEGGGEEKEAPLFHLGLDE